MRWVARLKAWFVVGGECCFPERNLDLAKSETAFSQQATADIPLTPEPAVVAPSSNTESQDPPRDKPHMHTPAPAPRKALRFQRLLKVCALVLAGAGFMVCWQASVQSSWGSYGTWLALLTLVNLLALITEIVSSWTKVAYHVGWITTMLAAVLAYASFMIR